MVAQCLYSDGAGLSGVWWSETRCIWKFFMTLLLLFALKLLQNTRVEAWLAALIREAKLGQALLNR